THYVPKWTEIAVTLAIVAAGFAIFRVIAQHFPIFEESAAHETESREEVQSMVGVYAGAGPPRRRIGG
ncbi:MAG TPA: hypothetical protein VMU80_08810, partial [Bryobacteraceae bacterium]|nr:hypothetical protein [Bryobacteraceae bacterium]